MARRPEELAFYTALRKRADAYGAPGCEAIEECAAELAVPLKRATRWLEKWELKGWWECGVSLRTGWFTKKAPIAIPAEG